jgi:hypothetical protein
MRNKGMTKKLETPISSKQIIRRIIGTDAESVSLNSADIYPHLIVNKGI